MKWQQIAIAYKGEQVQAVAPLIVSAGRATDIPAFGADRFIARLREGYSEWRNPFNGQRQLVSYRNTRAIVFWSKNPAPLLPHLPFLKERGINACLQFTLNDYEAEGLEPGLPSLNIRIDTFKRMVDALGFGAVVWRFDPLMLAGSLSVNVLLERVAAIAARLEGYTEKLVFSFADIDCYRRVRNRLRRHGIAWREFTSDDLRCTAEGISLIARRHSLTASTCAEAVDLSACGISHNSCIDGELLGRLFAHDRALVAFLEANRGKDSGQRPHCRCIPSKNIGEYGSCGYGCIYCYANP
jgi:hypothetical protein